MFAMAIIAGAAPETNGLMKALCGIYFVICLIPSVTTSIRRLHDVGLSGWCLIGAIIPILNFILGAVILFFPGGKPNKYGHSSAQP